MKRSGRGNESGFEQGDSNGPGDESVVRLRGLPFDSTKMDIVKFFDGTSFRERELKGQFVTFCLFTVHFSLL